MLEPQSPEALKGRACFCLGAPLQGFPNWLELGPRASPWAVIEQPFRLLGVATRCYFVAMGEGEASDKAMRFAPAGSEGPSPSRVATGASSIRRLTIGRLFSGTE